MPPALVPWQPRISYLLIDEQRYSEADLPADPNLAAAIVRLEQADTDRQALRVVKLLEGWLTAPEQQGLRRDLANWIRWVLLPSRLPEMAEQLPDVQDLIDMEAILQQTTRRWDLPLIEQGRVEGEARVVQRQLRRKFGELPASIEERLSQATTDQLETWADRVLTAQSLAEVFAD